MIRFSLSASRWDLGFIDLFDPPTARRVSRKASNLRRANAPSPFVPAFLAQPFLERLQMDLRKPAAKIGNVGLEPRLIEPIEHLVKLAAENDPHHQHRQPLELDWFTEYAAEDVGRLRIGQLASCNLQFLSEQRVRMFKSQRYERSDVVGSNRLIRLVVPDGVHQLAFQNPDFDLLDVIILHEGRGPQDGRRQIQAAYVLLDFPFRLPMVDSRVAFGPSHGTVDKMLEARLLRGVGQVLPLLHFAPGADRPVILDAVNAMHAAHGALQRSRVIEVSLNDL